jgi:hypothetical protein
MMAHPRNLASTLLSPMVSAFPATHMALPISVTPPVVDPFQPVVGGREHADLVNLGKPFPGPLYPDRAEPLYEDPWDNDDVADEWLDGIDVLTAAVEEDARRTAIRTQQQALRRSQAGFEFDQVTRNLLAASQSGVPQSGVSNLADEGARRAGSQAYDATPQTEGMLDIFSPTHNAREMAKQLVLLEDHIVHPPKHCPDCIRKHLLTAEALAEEACTLDPSAETQAVFGSAAREVRDVARAFLGKEDRGRLQQRVRKLRKKLSKVGFKSVLKTEQPTAAAAVGSASDGANPYPLVEGGQVIVWVDGRWRPATLLRYDPTIGGGVATVGRASGPLASVSVTRGTVQVQPGKPIIPFAAAPISSGLQGKVFQRYARSGQTVGRPVALSPEQLFLADLIQAVWVQVMGDGGSICEQAGIANPAQKSGAGCAARVEQQLSRAALTTAWYESNLSPSARRTTSVEDSVGLFQLNRKGGVGNGISVARLMDPVENASIAAAAVKRRLRDFKVLIEREAALQPTSVGQWVDVMTQRIQRPADPVLSAQARAKTADQVFPPRPQASVASTQIMDVGADPTGERTRTFGRAFPMMTTMVVGVDQQARSILHRTANAQLNSEQQRQVATAAKAWLIAGQRSNSPFPFMRAAYLARASSDMSLYSRALSEIVDRFSGTPVGSEAARIRAEITDLVPREPGWTTQQKVIGAGAGLLALVTLASLARARNPGGGW